MASHSKVKLSRLEVSELYWMFRLVKLRVPVFMMSTDLVRAAPIVMFGGPQLIEVGVAVKPYSVSIYPFVGIVKKYEAAT